MKCPPYQPGVKRGLENLTACQSLHKEEKAHLAVAVNTFALLKSRAFVSLQALKSMKTEERARPTEETLISFKM